MKFVFIFYSFLFIFIKFSEDAKKFIYNILYYAQGNKTVIINEECLGEEYDKDIENLLKYIENDSYQLIIYNIEKIAEDAYSNCPIDLTLSLFKNASNTIYSISFLSSIMSRMSQISKIIITEFKSENHSAESFGKAIGELIYSIISNDTISLENYNSDMGYDIFEGIFDGLTVNKSLVKCKETIVKGKNDLIQVFFDIIDILKNPKEEDDLMTLIFMKLIGVAGIITDCRIFYLISSIKDIFTEDGYNNIIQRINGNSTILFENVEQLVNANNNRNFHNIGESFGNILRIIFDFYVE
jgi:hypothetical protein